MNNLKDTLLEILHTNSKKTFKHKNIKILISSNNCIIEKRTNSIWKIVDKVFREENTGLRKLFLGKNESNENYYNRVIDRFITQVKGY